jgi:hypothetical protein
VKGVGAKIMKQCVRDCMSSNQAHSSGDKASPRSNVMAEHPGNPHGGLFLWSLPRFKDMEAKEGGLPTTIGQQWRQIILLYMENHRSTNIQKMACEVLVRLLNVALGTLGLNWSQGWT